MGSILIYKIAINSLSAKPRIVELKNSVLSLRFKFNAIDKGWTYDEYCRGVGSTVSRNDRISCYMTLTNGSAVNSDTKYKDYLNIVLINDYTKVLDTQHIASNANKSIVMSVTNINPANNSDAYCVLADREYTDPGKPGYYFSCSMYADKFYFERRD